MAAVQEYLWRVIAAVFLYAALQALFHDKTVGRMVSFACSLLILIVALSPLRQLDIADIARSISRLNLSQVELNTGFDTQNRELMAEIIKERAEAYILDKAKAMDFLPKSILVTVADEGQQPYPTCVSIRGRYTQQQRIDLTSWIENNLAIPRADQKWRWE